jgi:hypothetical protein
MKSKKTTWKEDNNRFVCFLDIMGFKNLIDTKSHSEVKEMMEEVSKIRRYILEQNEVFKKEERLALYKDSEIQLVSFSDSIILFTNEDKPADFLLLTYAARKILFDAGKFGIPIKGAISHGLITADFENSIFIGRPIVDAYLLEEELFYYGLVLDHNAESFYKKNITEFQGHDMYEFLKTPLKRGKVLHANLKADHETKIEDFEKFYETVCGATRQYVDNTIDVFNTIIEK